MTAPTITVELLRRGDPEATRRFLAILAQYARRYIPSQTEAESVAREALAELIAKLSSSEQDPDPAQLKIWTRTAVGRAARRAIRRYKKFPVEFKSRMHSDEAEQRPLSAVAHAHEQLARVGEALQQMPTNTQQAFVATVVDERTVESVAAELGVPVSTIRSIVFRARRKFERVLSNAEKLERLAEIARQVRLARQAAADPGAARPASNTSRSPDEKSSTAQL